MSKRISRQRLERIAPAQVQEDYHHIAAHIVKTPELNTTNAGELLKLLVLYGITSNNSHVYPSVLTLANRLKISVRTVQYALKKLQGLGYIQIIRRRIDRTHFKTNVYKPTKRLVDLLFIPRRDFRVTPLAPGTEEIHKQMTDVLRTSVDPVEDSETWDLFLEHVRAKKELEDKLAEEQWDEQMLWLEKNPNMKFGK